MKQIFISYCHKDNGLADKLYRDLTSRGNRVFIDALKIGIGERITEVLGDAISGSNFVIILASPDALASSWVQSELDTALHFELSGKGKVLVVRLRDSSLPALIRGKLYLDLGFNQWDSNSLDLISDAIQPGIFRNGWQTNIFNFGGNGGSAIHNLIEEGFAFYRIKLHLSCNNGFAGTSFEPIRGAVNVANYTHFTFKMRTIHKENGRIQVKFETKTGWPIKYVDLSYKAYKEWTEIEPFELNTMADADWERLERITFAADDRDIKINKDIEIDIADLTFYRI